jgi:hypothetical protein
VPSSFWPIQTAIFAADYANAYPYDLATEKNLIDFNIEQQASVVADYWALANNLAPLNNKNKKATVGDTVLSLINCRNPNHPSGSWIRFRSNHGELIRERSSS